LRRAPEPNESSRDRERRALRPLIFIVGHGKSGTTLLLALLDDHPELLVFPEESKFASALLNAQTRLTPELALTRTGANVLRYDEITMASGYRDYRSIDFGRFEAALRDYWGASAKKPRDMLHAIMHAYATSTGKKDRRFWVEKTPGHELHLETFHEMFEDMQAIYILRDPRDTFTSIRKGRRRFGLDANVFDFVETWRASLRAWRRFAKDRPHLECRYEDLVGDPDETLRQICGHIGISYSERLLTPTRNGAAWGGNSAHETKFQGISNRSVGAYRSGLSPRAVRIIESRLGAEIKSLV
jgi:hypothetical protein